MEIKIKDKNVRNNIFKFLDYIQEYLKKPNMSSGLYHYTSIEALYNGIIQQDCKLGQEICLRATNVLYLNDKEEIKIGMLPRFPCGCSFISSKDKRGHCSE